MFLTKHLTNTLDNKEKEILEFYKNYKDNQKISYSAYGYENYYNETHEPTDDDFILIKDLKKEFEIMHKIIESKLMIDQEKLDIMNKFFMKLEYYIGNY